MTREEAIVVLENLVAPPIRKDGKSMQHLKALMAIQTAKEALMALETIELGTPLIADDYTVYCDINGMVAMRRATYDLLHDAWERMDEVEE